MRPLEGIRVLEMGQLIAGPFCGQLLADFGAEVVKIEPPRGGDSMRQWGRTDAEGNPLWWPVIARNKKSLTLDLRKPAAQAIVRELVAGTDIIVENFRVGRMEEWGLGYEDLRAINPRLIMVRVTGFGQTGPYAERAGFAAVCEAMGGLRYLGGYPDRPPVRVGLSIGDTLAGQSGFQGALLALQHRHSTGEGQMVDASIYEAVLSVMESVVTEYDRGGHVRERSGSFLPGIAPSNAYPTADGDMIIIGANQDSLFRRLAALMEQPELADDERFANHQARGRNQAEIDRIVGEWTATRTAAWLVEALAAAGVPAGLTYRARDMLNDPHFQARESIVRVEDARLGPTAMQNVFPRLSASPGEVRHTGPLLGEHTDAVLREWLDYDDGRIARLRDEGII
ncbi:CaiB/BaiF CoA transferase family protein [Aurantimonas endophytica]|uniref:Crotonobetainyl-CoA:carnitine CoA-transferase CaiB-like acyl-CoA transferase n=1 Tax=Aurantimonas endophytica TaxID=1522175 RepID=A0A7W6HDE3_9HYPH|nr:CaiB/BaiF CoA-transferase family protein [Aurantimonas endophytica]MBB4003101.1 crotonobetainyl-CoA:carnitine CoA-transferase CaiB-like acyl-CoA transferase [Aurantimonas endophytica]MCO6403973.1 CoA transferase [Aurantimonas endophytica]